MLRPSLAPIAAATPETVPFVGPETIERKRGQTFLARLGANESRFGPAPSVIAAMTAALNQAWHYGDPENAELLGAIAAHHGVANDEIMAGPGVDALLGLAVRLYAAPGDAVVTSLGGYPTFNYHLAGYGARIVTVPYRDDREDIYALAEAAKRERAAMVYLANPDNPMGSWWSQADVRAFIAAVPETTMIVLDEAYGEFAPAGTLPPIDTSLSNLLRMRTFSKAYGLAGIRCGYIIGAREALAPFNRIRDHFGISIVGQAAGIAALADQQHLQSVVAQTAAARERIGRIAAGVGFAALPSATNFVAIDCGRDAAYARAVLEGLADRRIFIRKPVTPRLDRCIRISVGRDEDLDLLERELPEVVKALAGR